MKFNTPLKVVNVKKKETFIKTCLKLAKICKKNTVFPTTRELLDKSRVNF